MQFDATVEGDYYASKLLLLTLSNKDGSLFCLTALQTKMHCLFLVIQELATPHHNTLESVQAYIMPLVPIDAFACVGLPYIPHSFIRLTTPKRL